jgi:hypothetical protein
MKSTFILASCVLSSNEPISAAEHSGPAERLLTIDVLRKRMKNYNRILLLVLVFQLLAACAPKATSVPALQFDNPYAPQPGDRDLMAGDLKIDSASVALGESQPPQLKIDINYFPPTPCYQLRVEVSGPDEKNQISLKAYGVAEKDKPCALMALATPLQASLNLGSLPKGHYTVLLNGNQIGEIDS